MDNLNPNEAITLLREALERVIKARSSWASADYDRNDEALAEFECGISNAEIALAATEPAPVASGQDVDKRIAPVQGYTPGIPWAMHLRAYDAYCAKFRPQQELIEGNCRGGFGVKELDMFIPGWREELSELHQLRAEVDRLRNAAPHDFQRGVTSWMMQCFSMQVCRDTVERNHRFLEEALELVQALGCTASEAHQLVDYTFNRPIGEPKQEVGGVMVTLAALCMAADMDMADCENVELTRILNPVTMQKIRDKQASKPKHSPLPEYAATVPHDAVVPNGYWIMGTGIYHAPVSKRSVHAVLICKCETVEQAHAIKDELSKTASAVRERALEEAALECERAADRAHDHDCYNNNWGARDEEIYIFSGMAEAIRALKVKP